MEQGVNEPYLPPAVGEAKLWNESMLIWWLDEAQGISGFQRIGHLPNSDTAQIWHAILMQDGTRFRRNARLPFSKAGERGSRWSTEGLEFWFEDGAWQVAYESAECQMHLRVEDLHPVVDTSSLSATIGRTSKAEHDSFWKGHVEGGCRITGRLRVAERRFEIKALGFRDHSWGGIRDMSPIRSTRWVVGTTGPDLSYGLSYASGPGGTLMHNGWVHRDGKLHAVRDFDVVVSMDMDGCSWRRGEAWALLDDGSRLEFKTDETWDGVIVEMDPHWTSYETATTATVSGRRGVINIEIANSPRGGTEVVRSALRACVTDGLSQRPAKREPSA